MDSDSNLPSSINTGSAFQKLMWGGFIDTQTVWRFQKPTTTILIKETVPDINEVVKDIT
jgi:hypothetical protein